MVTAIQPRFSNHAAFQVLLQYRYFRNMITNTVINTVKTQNTAVLFIFGILDRSLGSFNFFSIIQPETKYVLKIEKGGDHVRRGYLHAGAYGRTPLAQLQNQLRWCRVDRPEQRRQ